MTDKTGDSPVPTWILAAAAVLITATFFVILTGSPDSFGERSASQQAEVLDSRFLVFEDMPSGAVQVYDGGSGETIAILAPGTNGFIRGVLRGLARERKRREIGAELPFHLTHWSDGRLMLEDPETDTQIDLNAFGPTNVEAFAVFLASWDDGS